MYQLTSGDSILRLSDNAFIPNDPGNRDYREYLQWIEEGNTPLPRHRHLPRRLTISPFGKACCRPVPISQFALNLQAAC